MNDFTRTLLLHDYDTVFIFHRVTEQYSTYLSRRGQCSPIPPEGKYAQAIRFMADTFVIPEDLAAFLRDTALEHILARVDSEGEARVRYRIRGTDGTYRWRHLKFVAAEDGEHIIAALRDETDEVMALIADANTLALKNSSINFVVSSLCENFMTVNVQTGMSSAIGVTGTGEMPTQRSFKEQTRWFAENVVVPEEREAYLRYFELDTLVRHIKASDGAASMFCNVHYGDGRHELLIRSTLVRDTPDLRGEYVLLFAQDITSIREIERANRRLMITSRHDKLTGLYNRAAAESGIHDFLRTADTSYCFLLMDIDYFKNINDRYGHLSGDEVLRHMGESMRKSFRAEDMLCRWGGDEFVVFLRSVPDRAVLGKRLEELRHRMACVPGPAVTLSIGGAFGSGPTTLRDLYRRADEALYFVKQRGRNGTSLA